MVRHRISFFLLGISACLVVGLLLALMPASFTTARAVSAGNWPMYGFNPHHTNDNPNEAIISKSNVAQLAVKWQITRSNFHWTSPVLENDILYTVAADTLFARHPTSGNKLWSVSLGNTFGGFTPAVVNNV